MLFRSLTKSEAVLLGSWRERAPDMGIRVAKAAKYLGIITGDDPELSQKAIGDRIDKISAQLDH